MGWQQRQQSASSTGKCHPTVQWDWNQFSSPWHSQFNPNRAEPPNVCLRPWGDQGGGHLPLPVGSQDRQGGE